MPGNLSNYAEIKLLDHVLGTTTYTKPSATHLALYTVAPTDAGAGTEVTGNGYARQLVTWSNATNSGASNNATVSFTASGGSWGTIVAVALCDAVSAGNQLWYGTLTTPRTIASGDVLEFAPGSIVVSLD